jgi:hypothetical protein
MYHTFDTNSKSDKPHNTLNETGQGSGMDVISIINSLPNY